MITKTMKIPAVSCKHCLMNIRQEIEEMTGVKYVDGDTFLKTVTVQVVDDKAYAILKARLQEIGYPVFS